MGELKLCHTCNMYFSDTDPEINQGGWLVYFQDGSIITCEHYHMEFR